MDVMVNNIEAESDEPASLREEAIAPMSKNARKKAAKKLLQEQRRAEWKAKGKERKQEKKRKRAELKEQGIFVPGRKRYRVDDQTPIDISVVIDLDFSEFMSQKERASMAKQLRHAYGYNRTTPRPVKLVASSFVGLMKAAILHSEPSCDRWRMSLDERPFQEIFEKEKLVYLTADSDNVLDDLDEGKVYIIGGIVDRNRHKGLCFKRAQELGIATAQLPLGQHVKMSSRRVLATNHVFEIMARYLAEKDWEKAILAVLPKRKDAKRVDEEIEGEESKAEACSEEEERCGQVEAFSEEAEEEESKADEPIKQAVNEDDDEGKK
ncbi:guanine-1-methyltransferase-domain-containing protein [Cladochytrium replicatum]|nr:guanine-1-methyltransferase-domain-containing protein [Cladochytrium replicatum]